ncbi:uncharacterized protein LOC144604537 isoform X2 [Rhinoraja longicauda]
MDVAVVQAALVRRAPRNSCRSRSCQLNKDYGSILKFEGRCRNGCRSGAGSSGAKSSEEQLQIQGRCRNGCHSGAVVQAARVRRAPRNSCRSRVDAEMDVTVEQWCRQLGCEELRGTAADPGATSSEEQLQIQAVCCNEHFQNGMRHLRSKVLERSTDWQYIQHGYVLKMGPEASPVCILQR